MLDLRKVKPTFDRRRVERNCAPGMYPRSLGVAEACLARGEIDQDRGAFRHEAQRSQKARLGFGRAISGQQINTLEKQRSGRFDVAHRR
jgi:hypothetical protein